MAKKKLIVVIGVHKAGTTSFYQYIKGVPSVNVPLKKELHFFTPLVYNHSFTLKVENYFGFFNDSEQIYLLDVSPSYFYGGSKLINELKKLDMEIYPVLMLRDPATRFVSFYKQGLKTGAINAGTSLEEYFENCKNEHMATKSIGGLPKDNFVNRGLREGCYSQYIDPWIKEFGDNLQIIFFEGFIQHPHAIMQNVCSTMGLNYISENQTFEIQNESLRPRSQFLSKAAHSIFHYFETFFRRNPKITKSIKALYNSVNSNRYKKGEFSDYLPVIRSYYREYNEALIKKIPHKYEEILRWNN